MKLTDDLRDVRLSVVRAAELVDMHPAHFRRLCRRGVFPNPKRTAKGYPYFDYELLTVIARVLKSGVGTNGEEVVFYQRKPKAKSGRRHAHRSRRRPEPDPYLADLAEALRQVGVPGKTLTPETLGTVMIEAFGTARPDLSAAIPVIAGRLLD